MESRPGRDLARHAVVCGKAEQLSVATITSGSTSRLVSEVGTLYPPLAVTRTKSSADCLGFRNLAIYLGIEKADLLAFGAVLVLVCHRAAQTITAHMEVGRDLAYWQGALSAVARHLPVRGPQEWLYVHDASVAIDRAGRAERPGSPRGFTSAYA